MKLNLFLVFIGIILINKNFCQDDHSLKQLVSNKNIKPRQLQYNNNNTVYLENLKLESLIQLIPQNLTLFNFLQSNVIPGILDQNVLNYLSHFSFTKELINCLIAQLNNNAVINPCVEKEPILITLFNSTGNQTQLLNSINNVLSYQLKDGLYLLSENEFFNSFLNVSYVTDIAGCLIDKNSNPYCMFLEFFLNLPLANDFTNCLIEENISSDCLTGYLSIFNITLPSVENLDFSISDIDLRKILLVILDRSNFTEDANVFVSGIRNNIQLTNQILNMKIKPLARAYLYYYKVNQLIDGYVSIAKYLDNCGLLNYKIYNVDELNKCISIYPDMIQIQKNNMKIISSYLIMGVSYANELELFLREFNIEILNNFADLLSGSKDALEKLAFEIQGYY